uniref:Zn-dependent hydrolase n=1 Tax=Ignisphaera aggregans TaxID=334771 RepID=A0A7C2ZCB6_9CREN
MPTTIRWHGHACFEIVSSKGVVIVVDPHDGRGLGLNPPRVAADIVLISHEHFDHNAFAVVAKPGANVLSMKTGEVSLGDVRIIGVETFHDKDRGKKRGRNIVYKIIVDDLNIVHLGDLGHVPDANTAATLKPIDILMIPVGGVFTIDASEAWKTIEVLDPAVVIPMHYWLQGIELPLKPVDEFLRMAPSTWSKTYLESNTLIIDKSSLKPKTIYVFKYV